MFDAYTVKKVLPRLFIAAILIQLSWEIFTLSIEVTNRIAWGIEGLIYAPFGGKETLSFANIVTLAGGGGAGIFAAMVIGGGVAAGFAAVNIGVVLSFALTALIGLLIGFAFLLFRQVLIVALLIVSPIALVAWVLPNTEKLWKIWWESFSKLLLVYPLILIMIAVGRVFAWVAAGVDPGGQEQNLFEAVGANDVITLAIIVIGYFGPFFLIPKTFQVAGSAFGNITGMVNNRSRGVFDRLKKGRQQSMANTWDRTKSGNRFQGQNAFSRRASQALQTATLIPKAGLRPRRMRDNIATARGSRDFENASKFMQEDESFQAIKNDDDKLWALMEGHDEESIRESLVRHGGARFSDPRVLGEAVSEIMRVQRAGGEGVTRIAATRAQSTTGTGFATAAQMLDSINEASGGDRSVAGRMLGEMRSAAVQSGRVDLGAAGFATMAQQMDSLQNARAQEHSIADAGQRAEFINNEFDRVNGTILDSAIDSSAAGQAIYGKPQSAAQLGRAHVDRVQRIVSGIQEGTHTQRDLDQALASTMGIYDAMGQASPQNARAMADELMGGTITDPTSGEQISIFDFAQAPTTVQNPAYIQMRRDYSGAAERAAAESRGIQPGAGGPPPSTPNQGPPGGLG